MTTVALPLAGLCPLNVFGFPSVSPFWTVSKLAWLKGLRSDYPLSSSSAEWLFSGSGPDADLVSWLLPGAASLSMTVVQACHEPYRMSSAPNPKRLFNVLDRVLLIARLRTAKLPFGWPSCGQKLAVSSTAIRWVLDTILFGHRVRGTRARVLRCNVAINCSMSVTNISTNRETRTHTECIRLSICALTSQLRSSRKEWNMLQSRGAIKFEPLFTTADIGLRSDASVEHVVKAFLNVGEALASRWIEMPRGILLLQSVPDEAASGAIYLYDRERHIFYFVSFLDGQDDALTVTEFDQLVVEYDLVSRAANPSLLSHCLSQTGQA
jgi:hypothetical protein